MKKSQLSVSSIFLVSQVVLGFCLAPILLLSNGYSCILRHPNSSESASLQPIPEQLMSSSEMMQVDLVTQEQTEDKSRYQKQKKRTTRWAFQTRGAAFLPVTNQLTRVYGTVWPAVELEISCCLTSIKERKNRLLLWGNAGWTTKVGESHQSTRTSQLHLIPFSLGLEYQIRLCDTFDLYFGAGPSLSLLRIKNYNGTITRHSNRDAFGLMTKAGLRCHLSRHFFLDFFGDYSFTPFGKIHNSIQNLNGNFSGFIAGGGIGGKF